MQESLLSYIASNFIKEYENVANSSISYLLNKYLPARTALKHILETEVVPNYYDTELSTKSNGRLDIAGKNSDGQISVVIEGKFWANLTDNQPVSYLKELNKDGYLLFLAPERRIESLKIEINRRTEKIDNRVKYASWNEMLNLIEQENKKDFDSNLESDITQIKELCRKMDEEGMPPLSESDLSPMNGRINYQFSALIDDCKNILKKWPEASFKGLKATPQKDGYGIYFRAYGFGCNLCFSSEDWFLKKSHTPFWLYVVDENFNEDKQIYHYLKEYDIENTYDDYASLGIQLKTGWDKNQIVQHIVETTKDVLLYLSKKIEN